MLRLGVCLHDVTVTLETDYEPLMAYAMQHLSGLVQSAYETPHIRVRCQWFESDESQADAAFPTAGDMNVPGKRMLGSANQLIWLNTLRMKGLQLQFRRTPESFQFDVVYRYELGRKRMQRASDYRYKRYFSLMSYLIYYPITWYLEAFRGWTVLHASALSCAAGGIVLGGLDGVGKTTTCVALMRRAGVGLVSENLVFTDGKSIFPCPEPIRLNGRSMAMLQHDPLGLTPMKFPDGVMAKKLFHARPACDALTPAAIFLPTFSTQRLLRRIDAAYAAEKMLAMNRLTHELDDYTRYAAALDMTWPQPGLSERRAQVVHQLTGGVPCFELGIDRSAGVRAVVQDIMRAVGI